MINKINERKSSSTQAGSTKTKDCVVHQTEPATFSILPFWTFFGNSYFLNFLVSVSMSVLEKIYFAKAFSCKLAMANIEELYFLSKLFVSYNCLGITVTLKG
jgi:hypothetical protein